MQRPRDQRLVLYQPAKTETQTNRPEVDGVGISFQLQLVAPVASSIESLPPSSRPPRGLCLGYGASFSPPTNLMLHPVVVAMTSMERGRFDLKLY